MQREVVTLIIHELHALSMRALNEASQAISIFTVCRSEQCIQIRTRVTNPLNCTLERIKKPNAIIILKKDVTKRGHQNRFTILDW